MINSREQLVETMLRILSEDEYKDKIKQVKEDLFCSYIVDISMDFIPEKVTEEELRQNIKNNYLRDYFVEENTVVSDADKNISKNNYQIEISQEFINVLKNLPDTDENKAIKTRLYELFINLNNYGLFQTSQKECIVATLYDVAGIEIASRVMCEATKRTEMFTEQMFDTNYRSKKDILDKKGKIIEFPKQ